MSTSSDAKIVEHVPDADFHTLTPGVAAELVEAEPIAPDLPVDLQTAGRMVAIAKVLEEQAAAITAAARLVYSQHLGRQYIATDAKSYDVKLDGTKVATATIPESSDKTAVDSPARFLEWVQAHPQWTEEVETIQRVRPTFEKRILSETTWVAFDPTQEPERTVDPDDPWADAVDRLPESRVEHDGVHMRAIHTPTGEFIPGLTFVAGRVNLERFALRFETPKKGKAITESNQRTGREIVADWLAEQGYEPFIAELIEKGVLQLEA